MYFSLSYWTLGYYFWGGSGRRERITFDTFYAHRSGVEWGTIGQEIFLHLRFEGLVFSRGSSFNMFFLV